MNSRIRRHFNATSALAVIALVFAMSGGAYAAGRYVITSTKQIKPSVLSALKGKAGAAGKNGANGTAGTGGATGPQGPPGVNGTNGTNGTNGESVTNKEIKKGQAGCSGEGGAEFKVGSGKATTACNGTTGFTATLPEGKTETGTWSVIFPPSEEEEEGFISLSFAIPLEASLATTNALYVTLEQQKGENGAKAPEQCTGTAEAPTAKAGNLCIYEGFFSPTNRQPVLNKINRPGTSGEPGEGAGTAGAIAFAEYPAGTTSKKGALAGSWAVTAE